ncbi:MAG: helix-turn-helix transcriptional regulator [Planctomycetaceae bacterium]|nr:helix-turn-helix transcriptional regulator [Planctomycetaceae bacterium]
MADALKAAIEASGMPFLTLEQETGVTRQSLMAFVKGQRTLRLDMADKLAVYFGLDVRPATKRKGK